MACHLEPWQKFKKIHNWEHPVGLYHRQVTATAPPSTARHNTSPALQETYATRCHRKAKKIIKDNNHPSHCLFTPLPSRGEVSTGASKLGPRDWKQLLSQGHRTVKQPPLNTERLLPTYRLKSLATLINGSLVTLNNATLNNVYISYITHISYVQLKSEVYIHLNSVSQFLTCNPSKMSLF
jgi:hypothetical protein